MNQPARNYTVIVLAGDRGPSDPVASSQGAPCKALTEVGGRALVLRVLDVLLTTDGLANIIVVGPKEELHAHSPELQALIQSKKILWLKPAESPCTSAMTALAECDAESPLLITTADHGFLSKEMLEEFLAAAEQSNIDAVAGLVPYQLVQDGFPANQRTALRFKGSAWCGCNLFAIRSSKGRSAVDYWRKVEKLRKKPWRIASVIGLGFMFSYLFKRLTLEDAMKGLGTKIGAQVGSVAVKHADAAIDIDSAADWQLVSDTLAQRAGAGDQLA